MTSGPGFGYGPGPGHGYGYGPPGDRWVTNAEQARMRAADEDRDRTADVLRAAFVEGRLSQDELDDRLGKVYAARTYADLSAQTTDLPRRLPVVPPPHPLAPQPTNSMAIGSFVCGLLQLFSFGLTAIPAVILGHAARRQIRRTHQPGDGFAVAGLVLGWLGIAFITVVVVGLVATVITSSAPGFSPFSGSGSSRGQTAHTQPRLGPGGQFPPGASGISAPDGTLLPYRTYNFQP